MEDLINQLRRAALLGTEMPPADVIANELEEANDLLQDCAECDAHVDREEDIRAAFQAIGVAKAGVMLDELLILGKLVDDGYDIRDAADLFAHIGEAWREHVTTQRGGK
jgi:hypothetical protein